MEEAIRRAFLQNIQNMMNSRVDAVNPLLVLHVNRNTIVQDTIKQVGLSAHISADLILLNLLVG